MQRPSLSALARAFCFSLALAVPATAAVSAPEAARSAARVVAPTGWSVTLNQETVYAVGPQGAVTLGEWVTAYNPAAAAKATGPGKVIVAQYGDPFRAVAEIAVQRGLLAKAEDLELVERAPLPWWAQGKGEMLHLRATINDQQQEIVAMVLTAPTGFGQWVYHCSAVACDAKDFAQNLPTLVGVWKSWRPKDRLQQERLTAALTSLPQIAHLLQSAPVVRAD